MTDLLARTAVRSATGIVVIAFCITAAACGSGGSHRLSKAEYAKRADTICGEYLRRVKALGTPSPPTASGLAKVATETLPLLDSTIGRLRALTPPENEQELAARWLVSLRSLRTDVVALRNRANANDLGGIRRLVPRAQRHNRQSNLLARQLAMKVCGSDQG